MPGFCFPSPQLSAAVPHITDQSFSDFDRQAGSVGNTDVRCIQLSPGRFVGRSIVVNLGQVTIRLQKGTQTLETQAIKPDDRYSFCLPLEKAAPFTMFGQKHFDDWIDIDPPGGEIDAVIPHDSPFALISIDRNMLVESDAMMPAVADWLTGLRKQGAIVKSRASTRRLRATILTSLETATSLTTPRELDFLCKSFALQLAYNLSIAWLKRENFSQFVYTAAFERFCNARKILLEQELSSGFNTPANNVGGMLSPLGTRRTIEQAFSKSIGMGPLTYWRVVRLHKARQKLADPSRRYQAIGDIAAEEGFWDFSRFSMQYRRHFGQRPSDTRKQT